jgi:hypothetical protein
MEKFIKSFLLNIDNFSVRALDAPRTLADNMSSLTARRRGLERLV